MLLPSHLRSTFIRQRDQSDCGVACLASVIRFHGGDVPLETLRLISGTDRQGTTMLGLFQAAHVAGLDAQGFQGDIENLKKVDGPCIIHLVIDNRLLHYFVCYGFEYGNFVVGDPGCGILQISPAELEKIWQTKTLLTLKPGEKFLKIPFEKNKEWKWFSALITDDLNLLGIAAVIGIFVTFLGMSMAIFSQKLIDEILPEKQFTKLIVGTCLLGFLLLVRGGLAAIRENFILRQSISFNKRVIQKFYDALLSLPKIFFDNRKTGDLIARLNDTIRIQNTIIFITGNVLIDSIIVLVSLGFIGYYSHVLILVGLCGIPLFFLIVYFLHDKIVSGTKDVMVAYAATESNYVDTLQGMGVVKSGNREALFSAMTNQIYSQFQDKIFHLGTLRIRLNLLADIIASLLLVSVFGIGSWLVLDEKLTLGELMAVLTMAMGLFPAISRLSLVNLQLQDARMAFRRMHELASIEPEFDAVKEAQKKNLIVFESLKVKDLSFRFPGRSQIFQKVNLELKKSEIIAVTGESGSGKSTIFGILQRFYNHENGKILINEMDAGEISIPSFRALLGVVPQQIKIFSGNLLFNICPGELEINPQSIIVFCQQTGFHSYFMQFPQNYMTVFGEGGVNISGGQQQLVAFARALYRQPQLLMLDEATSAMDKNTEQFVMNLLLQLKPQMGIIFSTHRTYLAEFADRKYRLEGGCLSKSEK